MNREIKIRLAVMVGVASIVVCGTLILATNHHWAAANQASVQSRPSGAPKRALQLTSSDAQIAMRPAEPLPTSLNNGLYFRLGEPLDVFKKYHPDANCAESESGTDCKWTYSHQTTETATACPSESALPCDDVIYSFRNGAAVAFFAHYEDRVWHRLYGATTKIYGQPKTAEVPTTHRFPLGGEMSAWNLKNGHLAFTHWVDRSSNGTVDLDQNGYRKSRSFSVAFDADSISNSKNSVFVWFYMDWLHAKTPLTGCKPTDLKPVMAEMRKLRDASDGKITVQVQGFSYGDTFVYRVVSVHRLVDKTVPMIDIFASNRTYCEANYYAYRDDARRLLLGQQMTKGLDSPDGILDYTPVMMPPAGTALNENSGGN